MEHDAEFRFVPYPCEGEPEDEAKGLLKDCGKPLPFVDRIVMTLEKEAVPVTTKFLQGYYDSPQISRVDVGRGVWLLREMTRIRQSFTPSVSLFSRQPWKPISGTSALTGLTPWWALEKRQPSARRNRKLRQAISIAVDWEEQIAIFEKGQGEAAHGPLPPRAFRLPRRRACGL
ncbi:MAG: hypothetical protein V8R49_03940 [Duodenibacillus massiliensis]